MNKRFSTKLKYATEEWLKEQSELFYFTGIKDSEITVNCALAKAVIMLKNKCMLIHLSY